YWTWLSARAAGGGAWRLAEMARSLRLYVLVQRGVHSLRVALLPYLCTPRARVPVAAFEVNLLRFAALGKEQGFRPVLVSEAHRAPEARRDYREAMARAAARAGVAFVDAHAQLPSDPKERAALFIDEVHLTEQGHERVAEILARELAGTGPR
ncbi:MAG: hypothetical protein HY303_19530, partial [Candidatus Wallbacteria bacterium]|nr:hypothetical protein [Candidatus Wallbacteria bacterium]